VSYRYPVLARSFGERCAPLAQLDDGLSLLKKRRRLSPSDCASRLVEFWTNLKKGTLTRTVGRGAQNRAGGDPRSVSSRFQLNRSRATVSNVAGQKRNGSGHAMRQRLIVAFLTVATAWAGAANAQSFNCRNAHFPDERLICQESGLARLDSQVASVFQRAMNRIQWQQRGSLEREEIGWVVARRQCGRNYSCIEQRYHRRIAHLSEMALIGSAEATEPKPSSVATKPANWQRSQSGQPGIAAPSTRPLEQLRAPSSGTAAIAIPEAQHLGSAGSGGGLRPTIQWVDPER
jgi:uncharacterized protein